MPIIKITTQISITATLKHIKKISDSKSIQFFNTLFKRIMFSLKMIQMNKNFYNPRTGHMVSQHKLEICQSMSLPSKSSRAASCCVATSVIKS